MKKTLKMMMALLLSCIMILATGITAFAAKTDKGTITVTNLTTSVDTTVNIYKVASLDDNGNGWVIEEWAKGIVASVNGGSDYQYKENKSMTDLKNAATTETATATDTNGTVSFTNVEIGSYLVLATDSKTEYNPMIADVFAYGNDNLATAKNVEIVAKGQSYKTDKTNSDDNGVVAVGDIVTYTITASVPYIEGTEDREFEIKDKITGADYAFDEEDGFSVTVAGEEYQVDTPTTEGEFTLDLSALVADNSNAGKTVVVTYKAIVTAVDAVTNTAESDHEFENGKGSTTKVFTGEATITKTDDNTNAAAPLAGAQFALYRKSGETKEYAVIDENGYITGVWGTEKSTVTTGTNGKATVKGLDLGTYYFEEVVAPEGYSLNTTDVNVEVKLKDGKTAAAAREDIEMGSTTMADTKLSALPATGGIGTYIFTIVGVIVMVVAGSLFVASRKKHAK